MAFDDTKFSLPLNPDIKITSVFILPYIHFRIVSLPVDHLFLFALIPFKLNEISMK